MLEALAEVLAPSSKETEQSLEDIRKTLAGDLAKAGENVLVVIDDLDRLSPKDLTEMIQLVKANGDLPRMIYLLLGDRAIIARHLGAALSVDGNTYLEKVVQVSLDLPLAAKWRVHSVLFKGLDEIYAPERVSKTFNSSYWREIFQPLSIYFDNLRSVNRFLTTLAFHVKMFGAAGVFEVNIVDLTAIEAIRLFDGGLYAAMPKYKKTLVGERGYSKLDKTDAEKALITMLADVPDARRHALQELISILFPYFGSALQDGRVGSDEGLSRGLRIASDKHFDKYFEFIPDPRELSEADIQKFLMAQSREEFGNVLNEFSKRSLLDGAVHRLREYVEDILKSNLYPAVLALCDVGDVLSREEAGMFMASPSLQAQFLVTSMLERLVSKSSGFGVLSSLLEESSGLSLPVHVVHKAALKLKQGQIIFGLTTEQTELLTKSVVTRLSAAARSGALIRHAEVRLFLLLWKEWGRLEDVRSFVTQLTSTPEGSLLFLNGMLCVAHSSVPNRAGSHDRPYILLAEIDAFSDIAYLESKIVSDNDKGLHDQYAQVIKAFRRAVNRRKSGKSDDAFVAIDDDDDDDDQA